MSPPSEHDLADKQAQRLRLRLTLLRNSLSNLRSELTTERELLRLEKMEASTTEQRAAQSPDQQVGRVLHDERSQLALQRQQSAIWFRQKLGEVDRQCSQVMERVQRHMEPLRTIMSSLDMFAGDQCLDYSASQASFLPIDDWTDDSTNVQSERQQDVHYNGAWGQEGRDMSGYCRGSQLEGDNHSKGWRLQGDIWKCGENQKRPRGPNDWLDDEISLASRFVPSEDPEGITLLSRNSSNSFWAQYD